jgi:hypothetical protein
MHDDTSTYLLLRGKDSGIRIQVDETTTPAGATGAVLVVSGSKTGPKVRIEASDNTVGIKLYDTGEKPRLSIALHGDDDPIVTTVRQDP